MERLSQSQVTVSPFPSSLDLPGQDSFAGGTATSLHSSFDPVNVEQAMKLLRMGAFKGIRSETYNNHQSLNGSDDPTAPSRTNFNLDSSKSQDILAAVHPHPASATTTTNTTRPSVHGDAQLQVGETLPPVPQDEQPDPGSVAFPGMPPTSPAPGESEEPKAVFNPMRAAAAAAAAATATATATSAMASNPAVIAALAAHVQAQQSAFPGMFPASDSNTVGSGGVPGVYGSPMWGPSSAIARAMQLTHHTQRRPRSEKKPIPDDQKDDKYYERRKRNNLAAKKSRDQRKTREDEIAIRASYLEKENAVLKAQVQTLQDEANSLRHLLLQKKSRQGPPSSHGAPVWTDMQKAETETMSPLSMNVATALPPGLKHSE